MGFGLLHVASYIDRKIICIYKVQYGYSKKWRFSQNYEKWIISSNDVSKELLILIHIPSYKHISCQIFLI